MSQTSMHQRRRKAQKANYKPYLTKAMLKAIMKRSEVAKKYHSRPTGENQRAFK